MPDTQSKMEATLSPSRLATDLETTPAPVLIDVRTPVEFRGGHIPGSYNLPMHKLLANPSAALREFNTSAPLVLVCHSGVRASQTLKRIQAEYPTAQVLEGGVVAWKATGHQLQKVGSCVTVERQTRMVIGSLIAALALGSLWVPQLVFGAAAMGIALIGAGVTGTCPLQSAISAAPWNNRASKDEVA